MGTRLKWIAFGLMVLFQLALPGWMFVQRERVLTGGAILLFRTAPIDPRDPFRGEYVALNFEAETGQWAAPAATHADEARRSAYAVFVTDSAGFAHITRLTTERPVDSTYVRVEFMVFGTEGVHRVSLPFDRFYLEEGDGAATEQMLQPQVTNDTPMQPRPAHAVVRVLDGEAVIEDLVVDGRSIHEWLQELQADQ
jgi:uncharacterized membrane-anchored protein